MSAGFVHLNAHSAYSLLEGMPSVKKLAQAAAEMGMPALGIVDVNSLFSSMETTSDKKGLPGKGIQPIVGTQLNITREGQTDKGEALKPAQLTLLVQNTTGWQNILQLSSAAFLNSPENEPPQIPLQLLHQHHEGLICLTGGGRDGLVGKLINEQNEDAAKNILQSLAQLFGNRLYVELQRHGMVEEKMSEATLVQFAYELGLPLVATNDSRFLKPSQFEAFNAMLAIGQSCTLQEIADPAHSHRLRTFTPEHYLKSAGDMLELFADLPEATQNTLEIAKRCAFSVPRGTYYMPAWIDPETGVQLQNVDTLMREESEKGLQARLEKFVFTPHMSPEEKAAKQQEYTSRLNFELETIIRMGYPGYFMITSDFIRWAKSQNIPVGPGRGSGAGSIVAWALEITDLDPIMWELYFERFLNPERVSLPDFDIDFCQDRRDEVIAYVRERYGHGAVSQIITFGTLKARACIRDVGRVLQMPFGAVSRIAAFIPEGPASIPIEEALETDERMRQLYEEDEEIRALLNIAIELEGAYRHASTHAAGMIIADRNITKVCPLYKDPRSDMPATQYSMSDAEEAGLVKFDFLGLKTLSVIKLAVDMAVAAQKLPPNFEINRISLEDEPTFNLLKAGHTVGVFQVESKGMTEYLKKMVPDRIQYLSDVIALYRPGPMASGMLDDFIDCRHGRKEPNYPHPALEPVLKETFGVPVYQEQIMRMAQVMAGYSLGGADMLRRAMGKKKPEEMRKQRQIFNEGTAQLHNLSEDVSNKIFDLMDAFAGYGFNKAHTAAYAFIAYQTAWLKANYPLEFMAASMTYDRGNSDKILKFVNELERMHVPLLAPSINHSQLIFTVENNTAVRFALGAIKGAGDEAMLALVKEREKNGPYTDIYNFVERQNPKHLNRKQMEVLIKSGALDSFGISRATLFHNVDTLLGYLHTATTEQNSNQIGLFGEGATEELPKPPLKEGAPWSLFDLLENEQQSIGFFLSSHPLESYKKLKTRTDLTAIASLEGIASETPLSVKVAAVVHSKREVKTKTGKRMAIVLVSDTSGQEEVVFFPEAYAQHGHLLEKNAPLMLELQVQQEGERLRVSVENASDLDKMLNKQEKVTIQVHDVHTLPQLATLLGEQDSGNTLVEVVYAVPGFGTVKVALEKQYHLKLRTVEFLQHMPQLQVQKY